MAQKKRTYSRPAHSVSPCAQANSWRGGGLGVERGRSVKSTKAAAAQPSLFSLSFSSRAKPPPFSWFHCAARFHCAASDSPARCERVRVAGRRWGRSRGSNCGVAACGPLHNRRAPPPLSPLFVPGHVDTTPTLRAGRKLHSRPHLRPAATLRRRPSKPPSSLPLDCDASPPPFPPSSPLPPCVRPSPSPS